VLGTPAIVSGGPPVASKENRVMEEQARKTIAKYLEEMHSLLTHGLQPFDRQLDEKQMKEHPEALRAVQGFKCTLESLVMAIDARMKALGTSPTTAVQDAASAVTGSAVAPSGATNAAALRQQYVPSVVPLCATDGCFPPGRQLRHTD
jgi:hypothetical protein